MMKNKQLGLILALLSLSVLLHSKQNISSLKELAIAVEMNNISIKSALWEKDKTESNIPSLITWEKSSLSFNQYYDESGVEELSADGHLELSIMEAVAIYGKTDFEGRGETGISLSPLWHSDERKLALINLESVSENVDSTIKTVNHTAAEAYLNWSIAFMTRENTARTVLLNKALYDDEKIRYDLGESNLDDVRETLINWSESRANLSESVANLQNKQQNLFETTGLDSTLYQFTLPDPAVLETEIKTLKDTLESSEPGIQNLDSVRQKIISNQSLETKMNDIRIFDPQLSIGAAYNWNDSNESWISASAGISFALDDYNRSEKQELAGDIDLAGQTLNQLMQTEDLKLSQYEEAIGTSDLNYELALLQEEQSGLLVDEGKFLFETGDISELKLEEIILEHQNSRIKVFETLIQKYLALSILKYYI